MIEFLLAGIPLLFLMLAIVQLSILWAGKSAVDTAAHLAARKFARVARDDFPKAREMAFLEAFQVCRNRPGDRSIGRHDRLDVTKDGDQGQAARPPARRSASA